MNKISIGVIIVLLGWALWAQLVRIPSLERQLQEWEDAPPTIEEILVKGPTDTLEIIKADTVEIPVVEESEITEEDGELRSYKTPFGDSMLRGIVNSRVDGTLVSTEVEYWFKRDIVSTNRVDLKTITITNNVVAYRDRLSRGLDLGMMIGGGVDGTIYMGPSLGYMDRQGNSFSYAYDVLNETHFLTYRRRLSFPKISLF